MRRSTGIRRRCVFVHVIEGRYVRRSCRPAGPSRCAAPRQARRNRGQTRRSIRAEGRRLAAMKLSLGTFAALLITGSVFLQPAHAQSVPQGSYRTSCSDIRVEDRTLTAVCRIAGGREQSTAITHPPPRPGPLQPASHLTDAFLGFRRSRAAIIWFLGVHGNTLCPPTARGAS